jgi:hypothetical protein
MSILIFPTYRMILYSLILRQPRQRTIVLVAAHPVLHARVNDGPDRHVHIVRAQILEQIDHLPPLRPQVHLRERAVVAQTDLLAARLILAGHNVEPTGFVERTRLGYPERWRSLLVWPLVEPCGPFVAHHLAENAARLFERRKNRRHSQIPAGLVLEKWVVYGVV